jgi:nitrogen PTS system EIIA component
MDISMILKPCYVRCEASAGSKKHALDLLSEVLADAVAGPSAGVVLEGLANRERLGSTGLGSAVAMPHTRVAGINSSAAAFLKLTEPVDFGSPDGRPVDLLFGLVVPEEWSADDVKEMGRLVKRLRDPVLQEKLRTSDDPNRLCTLLVESLASADASH